MANIYASIIAAAADRAALRNTAARKRPFTRNMAVSGRTEDNVNRKTERDAFDSIRVGRLVLWATDGQGEQYSKREVIHLMRELKSIHEGQHKHCRRCGDTKGIYHFPPDKRNRDGHGSYCYHCQAEIQREYRDRKRVA